MTGDERDIQIAFFGDDSPPLMSRVPEPPPSHWGKITTEPRTASEQYLRFLYGDRDGKQRRAD